jgi:hypothetical protein
MSTRPSILVASYALLCGAAIATSLFALRKDQPMSVMSTQAPAPNHSPSKSASHTAIAATLDAMTAAQPAVHASGEKRHGDLDPVEARARMEANIAALDARFGAETLDMGWAMRQQRVLGAFLATDALAAQALPVPDGLQIACRSTTCRISARFTDPVDAEMTTQRLAMQVAADLPYGAVMPRALDDGRIQVDAWYSSTRIAL